MRIRPLSCTCFCSTLVLTCSLSLSRSAAQSVAEQPRERPPVSWVNAVDFDSPELEHHILDSQSLGHEVGYVVWTPASYEMQTERRFPVVYFLHGMGGTESADAEGFSNFIRQGIAQGTIPEMLVVFPNGGRSGYRGEVEKMIVDELVPLIDSNYRTISSKRGRALAGFSMGGQGSVRLSLLWPDVFCAAGSWGGGIRRGREEVLSAVEQHADQLRSDNYAALLINGDQDRPKAYEPLAEVFTQNKIQHEVVILPETPHKLGRYYQLSGPRLVEFLGKQLSE